MTTSTPQSYSFYPGCSLMATNKAYGISARNVARALGSELVELDDWNCCGATAYVAIREKRSFILAARNLALADREGRDLATVCSGCYVVLRKTSKYLAENLQLRSEIRGALQAGGMDYVNGVRVRHFMGIVVNDFGEDAIRGHVVQPLTGLKVAPYYGCQIGRPFGEIDDPEFPESMDRLLAWLGAEVVPFPLKAKCCGGLMMTTQPEIGRTLTGRILKAARAQGADCIATACPLCQINLEAYQRKVGAAMGANCRIPVLYFTQLMGNAFGLGRDDLALNDNLTPAEVVLANRG